MILKTSNKKIDLTYLAIAILAFLHGFVKIYVVNESEMLSTCVKYIQYLDYGLLFACILRLGYSIKELLIQFVLVIAGVIVLFTSGEALIMSVFLVLGACRNKNFKIILQNIFYGILISFFISLILYFVGISDPGNFTKGIDRINAISLGYTHPNVCGEIFKTLILLYFAIKDKKFVIKDYIILVVTFLVNYIWIDCRTIAVEILLFPLFRFILIKVGKSKYAPKFNYVLVFLPLALFILVMWTTLNYNTAFSGILDILLNGRITLNNYNYYNLGVSIFGQKVVLEKDYILHNTIDCAYMVMLLQCGILGTITFISGYMYAINKIIKNNKFTLLTAITIILLSGVVENSMLDIIISFPLIYISRIKDGDSLVEDCH